MAEQLLDDPQVRAALEQVRREGVAQGVGRDARPAGRPGAEEVEPEPEAADAERRAAMVQEHLGRAAASVAPDARRAPRREDGPAVGQVVVERAPRRPPEQADPLLAALAEDPDLAPPEVERRRASAAASSLIRRPAA